MTHKTLPSLRAPTLLHGFALLFGASACNTQTQNLGHAADAATPADGGAPDDRSCETLAVRNVDLLFMVDNSGSMQQEQASLRREFPELIRALTTGDRDGDGARDFPAVENLHLGVVSGDLGLPGIAAIDKCDGFGDDGALQHAPSPQVEDCASSYPAFLTYDAATDDGVALAGDFACISTLGTDGCGVEQQLESTLKALWPTSDDSLEFLAVTPPGNTGQGDRANAGFLRAASGLETSVLGIVLVTDEEDCSMLDTRIFTPAEYLPPNDPLVSQDLNLRCYHNPQELHPIRRYVDGFRALRPGAEQLVVFSAIVGVPPDLVEPEDYEAISDWADDAARNAFYDRILDDDRMQEVPDPTRTPEQGGQLMASCNTRSGVAYPPRRIVQVARELGENSLVQSICQDDFSPAIDALVARIGRGVTNGCELDE